MDHPDLYAEAYLVTVSDFGVQLTLMRRRVTDDDGTPVEGTEVIGRVRFSRQM